MLREFEGTRKSSGHLHPKVHGHSLYGTANVTTVGVLFQHLAEQLIGSFHCAGVHLKEALSPHKSAIKRILKERQDTVDTRLEELMMHVVQEDANDGLVGHLLDALGESSIEDTSFAGRGLWLRIAIVILNIGAVGTMLSTCFPVITNKLLPMIEILPLHLLAPSTQVRPCRHLEEWYSAIEL